MGRAVTRSDPKPPPLSGVEIAIYLFFSYALSIFIVSALAIGGLGGYAASILMIAAVARWAYSEGWKAGQRTHVPPTHVVLRDVDGNIVAERELPPERVNLLWPHG